MFLVQYLLTANYLVRINSGIGFSPASTAPARGTSASRRWTSRHSSDATYASHSSARRDVTIFICSCSSRSQALLVGHSMTTFPAKSSWRRTLAFAPYSSRSALQTSRSLRTLRAISESSLWRTVTCPLTFKATACSASFTPKIAIASRQSSSLTLVRHRCQSSEPEQRRRRDHSSGHCEPRGDVGISRFGVGSVLHPAVSL